MPRRGLHRPVSGVAGEGLGDGAAAPKTRRFSLPEGLGDDSSQNRALANRSWKGRSAAGPLRRTQRRGGGAPHGKPPRRTAPLRSPFAPGRAAAGTTPEPATFFYSRCPDCRTGQPPGKYKLLAPTPLRAAPCAAQQPPLRSLGTCEEVELTGSRRRSSCQYLNDPFCYAEAITRPIGAPPQRRWLPVHRCGQADTTTVVAPAAAAPCYGGGEAHALPPGPLEPAGRRLHALCC